ncbi:hypothetical protein JQ609_20525 [Bradyrhizobium sp. AUGA SZCCT0169]|uniref:DUF5681 domain-containing protein n=1 Tax=Bradyrhizobium sp. AUGA SZCCT0169 TaxID=2807663 RepID=UPI001BA845B7|nr:DUF5681 domain-containing protein [Bradyrhizobium sp. AUGA SZCCT0169]MBR1249300.1 hypothetical protein [Bradyrhizobium sp. AUGA SZCCT0169]
MADESEQIGYRRPPKSGRFKPGSSGNPRGRPKGTADFKADLAAEMRERITLRDKNGRPHKVTKQRALIKLLFSSALQNEKSAINALLACMRYFGSGNEEPPGPEAVDLEDLDMIKNYVARSEARIKHERAPIGQPKSPKRKGKP